MASEENKVESDSKMGMIKDGTVTGFLPSAEAFVIHYPAYPSSTPRAIETLGGTEGIVKARIQKSNKLELRFRPEDPYSHPVFGELHPCNNLLLKISKRKSNEGLSPKCQLADSINSEQQTCCLESEVNRPTVSQPGSKSVVSSEEVEARKPAEVQMSLYADIVVRISEAYNFNGMVDYQHVLAVHADVNRRKKRNWADVEPHFEKGGLMDMDQEDLMILLPPLFSLKDVPEKLLLRPSSTQSLRKKQEGVVQQHPEIHIDPNYFMDFDIEEIPKKFDWEQYIPKGSDQWQWQMAVFKLFEERPIWPKDSVAEHLLDNNGLELGNVALKRLLFRVAYYFSNGPFLRFWIRKGYDPRKDPESRIYQRLNFRVPSSLLSYCDDNRANNLKHRWKDICAFRVFPLKCHTYLQLFELSDDYIQQEIRKPPKQTTCTPITGWFSELFLENLRSRVAVRFLSVYPQIGAESQLKSATERFEKSKKMLRLNEVGHQQINKEIVPDKDKEKTKGVDGDEDDIEVENDEELDAYESLNKAGEDGEVSLQPDTYFDGDNISRNYLQELFGSFPSILAGGSQSKDADGSDEEYQIYEHFSDGNLSEDDDY